MRRRCRPEEETRGGEMREGERIEEDKEWWRIYNRTVLKERTELENSGGDKMKREVSRQLRGEQGGVDKRGSTKTFLYILQKVQSAS